RHGGLRFLACDNGTRLEYVIIDSARTLSLEEIAEVDDTLPDDEEPVPSHLAHGGGISIYNCSPTLEDVTVRNSLSYQDGGGIWVYQAAPTIARCVIFDNEADGSETNGISEGNGGGVVFWGSEPNFFANTIYNNHAVVDGGAFYVTSLSAGKIANNLCYGNSADGIGGGLAMYGDSNPLLLNNVFYDNIALSGTDGLYFTELSMPVMRNSVVWASGVLDSPLISVSNASPAITDSYILGDYEDGVDIYTDVPEWDADFMPIDESSNLVDMGNVSSMYEDYSFPPSLGDVRGDIGISGGPYAGYWGAPLRISVFRNPSIARSLSILVNSVDDLESIPSLKIEQFSGDEVIDELPTISEGNNAWGMGYSVSESAIIQFIAEADWFDGEAVIKTSVRREIIVSIYSQAEGASIASEDGSSFTLPSYAVNKQMLLLANDDLGTDLPPNEDFLVPAGARFTVDAPVDRFNKPATIELPYDPAVVRVGRELGLSVWLLDAAGEWTQLESFVDTAARTVQAETYKPGTFVVLYEATGLSSELLPESTQLSANYPNPFNPTTTIPFSLRNAGDIRLTLFNVLGQKVATITDGHFGPGTHIVMWNGRDDAGQPVASGVYFYRMETNPGSGSGLVQTRKLVLMR
ncbi:MAG TPA: T9SS type A sorting domain-containing protein, partial [Bacteroidetes bacterium]|nr:T9SS type A sorting domain-containing protein [Bacteroidota bacterium]HEX04755.1 T9SS type A sorting domain-containing protein [Bacteroidota bacterium]